MHSFTEDHYTPEEWTRLQTEPIHELTQHIIMSRTSALQHISARNYIVGSVDFDGYWSFAGKPVFHATEADAKRECDRLARANSGKAYVYVKLAGAMVTNQVTEY